MGFGQTQAAAKLLEHAGFRISPEAACRSQVLLGLRRLAARRATSAPRGPDHDPHPRAPPAAIATFSRRLAAALPKSSGQSLVGWHFELEEPRRVEAENLGALHLVESRHGALDGLG